MPKSAASGILRDVWQDRGLPVDPVWIARQLGLGVVEAVLKPDISGALVKRVDEDPLIVLNQKDNVVRKRFTCAHELGHYVQRLDNPQPSYEYVDLRGPAAANGTNGDEIFANQFAACLLMPEGEIKRLHSEGHHPSVIAARFGVSGEAVGFRLKKLGLR